MDIQINQILFQLINFSVVLFVLNKFLYKPLTNILEQRKNKVALGQKAAEANLKTEKELEKTKTKIVSEARAEADEIVKEAKKKAKKDYSEIMADAKKKAEKVLEKERKSLESLINQDREDMQKQFAGMVTQTTEQLLKKYLTAAEHKKIISSQIKDLKTMSIS